jgi:hypothetical protein
MTRDVIFRRQYLAGVSESQAARYRAAQAVMSETRSGKIPAEHR